MHAHFLGVAVPLAPALPLLAELLCLIVTLGMIYAMKYIVRAFFGIAGGTLGKLPIVGGWFDTGLHTIERKVSSILGEAVDGVEKAVGYSWHQLARLVDWTYHELRNHSNLIYTLATVMLGQEWAGAVRHVIVTTTTRTDALERYIRAQVARIIHAEERLRHGIGEDVLPALRSLDRRLDRVLGKDLPAIRAREAALEHGAGGVWKWIRSHPGAIASGAFAGAVAWALTRIGAGWVRCTRANKLGKSVCGLDDGLLDALLADALLIVGTISIVELARELQAITPPVVDSVRAVIREAA